MSTIRNEAGPGEAADGERREAAPDGAGRAAVRQLVDGGWLDSLFDRVDAGERRLTGEGGVIPEMIKAVVERGLQAELADHLGYEKGDPWPGAGRRIIATAPAARRC